MTHFALRDLRRNWSGESVIYLPPPIAAAAKAPKPNRVKLAYDAGYAARLVGRAQAACPHNSLSARKRFAAWRMGWSQADRESVPLAPRASAHPIGYVPGVWKDLTTPFGSALLTYKFQRRTRRQRVADWCRSFRSKSGWKATDGRASTGGAVMVL
jgi:ribosome modulation factor